MRTLFVTRKFPPSTGGMENMAASLHSALEAQPDHTVRLIKFGGSNAWLPVVYPWLFVRTAAALAFGRYDTVYLQDGVLAPFAWLRWIFRSSVFVITIHGLEVTYRNPIYRAIVPRNIARCDLAVAISNETRRVLDDAVPRATTTTINNGVDDAFVASGTRAQQLATIADAAGLRPKVLAGRKLLVTTGRLVERKGVHWFIDSVLPELVHAEPAVFYAVAGAGPDERRIREAISRHGLAAHVALLGRVSDATRNAMYTAADAFVMPNVDVAGDMEGFGLVALEASSCGTPAVATRVGGIPDAVTPGKNGLLVDPGDAAAFGAAVLKVLAGDPKLRRAAVREHVVTQCGWDKAAAAYAEAFASAAAARR